MSTNTGKGPSTAELQRYIREKRQIEMILLTGQKIRGVMKWFDETAYCVTMEDGESITLLRTAVIGYRLVPGAPRPAGTAPQAAPEAAKTE